MAQGLGRDSAQKPEKPSKSVRDGRVAGSRRIFAPQFKLQVLDSYRRDADCRGNQRATARKYGIHRRQIQKWLQAEASLRTSVEAALNLSPARQRDDSAEVAKPPPERARDSDDDPDVDVDVDVDVDADDEDDDDVDVMSAREPDRALDFTCAALSKRRSFSLQFKLEVLDAFREDETCRGNQRATARKFGINRRQVQKWLGQEVELRGEAAFRGGMYRQRLGRWPDPDVDADDPNLDRCWDLSGKRTSEPVLTDSTRLEVGDVSEKDAGAVQFGGSVYVDDVQETALCLKVERREPEDERASVAEVAGTVADLRYFEPGAYSFAPQPPCFCYSARMYRLYPAYPLDFGSPWVKPERHINMFR